LIVTASCHRKIAPDGDGAMGKSERRKRNRKANQKADEKDPTFNTTPTDMGTKPKESLEMGKTVYVTKCTKCHEAKTPGAYTKDEWTNILKAMIPKAKLNDVESKSVTAYVMSNAK
jgi:cytochrome c5